MIDRPLTRAERRRMAEQRREESAWRTWAGMTREQQDHQRLRSRAREAAAFALYPIMERENLEGLQMIAAGELANAAVEAFERVMRRGLESQPD